MELILNWFSNSGQQKIQTTALQLHQLLSSGKILVKLPALADQEATISCTYMLTGTPHSSQQRMSSDSLQEFVNKLYLNWHQEQNPEAFDESIDTFLSCHKVHGRWSCSLCCRLACTEALLKGFSASTAHT